MENYNGITSEEAKRRQLEFGKNELEVAKKRGLLRRLGGIVCEPMFILLLGAAAIYFVLG